MRRFFISGRLNDEIVITGSDAHHLYAVLRCKAGQEILVADADGRVAKMELTSLSDTSVRAALREFVQADTEAPIAVTLVQCLPKGDKMELVVQKAVELGAAALLPVVSRNCVVKYDAAKRQSRCQKWQRIADEAAKQCGRTVRLDVLPIADFAQMLSQLPDTAVRLFCYEMPGQQPLRTVLKSSESREYIILIGPEGGFSAEEAAMCRQAGFEAVGLGPRILRTETAAIAALSMVLYEKGDLGGI